jgi:hypothetical protein
VTDVSLIDMAQLDRMTLYPEPDDHTGGCDTACAEVERELHRRSPHPDKSDVAVRSYGDGYVAVGIAGPVDRFAASRFGTLLRGLRPVSPRELLVTLVLLGPWHPQLSRVIKQARVHHLIDGGRLDLRGAPPEMLAALSVPPSNTAEGHPIPTVPDREPCLEQWGLRW